MASVDLVTSAGLLSQAQPFKARSVDLLTAAGGASSTGRVAWGGSASPLSGVPWLPKAGTPLDTKRTVTLSADWDRALRWLFEQYVGGIRAKTAVQIQAEVLATQQQVVQNTTMTENAVSYAAGVAATAAALREVAVSNGLSGAESVPEVPREPTGTQYEP